MVELTAWQIAEQRPGMMHWPTEANRDAKRFCAGCAHADPVRSAGRDLRKRARCGKMAEALKERGRKGKPKVIPDGTPGCMYWEMRG